MSHPIDRQPRSGRTRTASSTRDGLGADHAGERAIQRQAHEGGPGWGSPMFGPEIPHGFYPFIRAQRMLIIGAADNEGAIWSSIVSGPPGFAQPADDRTIVIDALPARGDPLREVFAVERDIGILALQPQTRRRIRVNGVARRDGDRLLVRTEQVLGNCPKYLQARVITGTAEAGSAGRGADRPGKPAAVGIPGVFPVQPARRRPLQHPPPALAGSDRRVRTRCGRE